MCGYKTAVSHNLKVHFKVKHENIKPFPCNVCEARFDRNTHLERHVKGKMILNSNNEFIRQFHEFCNYESTKMNVVI